jgi:hypothetical protein
LGTVAVAIYVWIKREKLFVNKKKRFWDCFSKVSVND